MHEEDEKERRDRQLIELLNELWVALPGVQVLFAFLLIVPFTAGADYIVTYDNAVRDAADALGFVAVLPEDLLEILRRQYEPYSYAASFTRPHIILGHYM